MFDDIHTFLDLLDLRPARFYQLYPPPGLAPNIRSTTTPTGSGAADGQFWTQTTTNFLWQWDANSSQWVPIIGS